MHQHAGVRNPVAGVSRRVAGKCHDLDAAPHIQDLSILEGAIDAEPRLPAPGVRDGKSCQRHGIGEDLARERPDLLCTYNWGSFDAVAAAASLGMSSHLHHEDGFNSDEARRRRRRRNWARRALLGRCSRVIVPSRVLATVAREEWRLRPEHVALVPNGVRVERFRPDGPGREEVRARLEERLGADFCTAVTRPPTVYRGNPFQIEVGLAYGGALPAEDLAHLNRFANRVPLQFL